jgi:hypothetical protein
VTEDADLGVRLALAGYRVRDLPSATLEEAPSTWKPWFGQRIRWMKGFMQVVITHSRHPLDALRALGPRRFVAAVTMTLGTVVTALGYPLFMAVTVFAICDGTWLAVTNPLEAFRSGLGLTLFAAGLVAMLAPAVVALHRRRWWRLYAYVPLLPLYYGLVSIAAWHASPVPLAQDGARLRAHLPLRPPQRSRSRSCAASAGGRFRLKEPTKRPFLSMR